MLMKRIIILVMTLTSLLFSSCSHRGNSSKPELTGSPSGKQKIEDVVRGFFDKQEWKYQRYIDEDSVITFRLGINGENETFMLNVHIFPDNDLYQIVGRTETTLPQDAIKNGMIAMNDYNMESSVVSGYITTEGNIIFWLGRNIDGNTFSEKAFSADFYMVTKETDDETAQIYKHALNSKGPLVAYE